MLIPKKLALLLCLAALPGWVQAQDPAQTGRDASTAAPASMPLLNQSTLAFSPELERSNYVSGGLSLGTTYDDNALNASSDRMSNFTHSFLPFIALEQSRARLQWKLDYAGGLVLNQHLSARNQASHDLGLEGEYRLSPHVTLLLRDHFFRTTGFYDRVSDNFKAPSGGLLQRPNQFVITPLAKQIGDTATAQLDYQFGRDSKVGASGNLNLLHYRDVPLGANLIDSQSLGAEAYYNHRIVSNNWVGLTYRYQKLTFSPLENRTFVHSVLLTDTIYLARNMTLALFVGPERWDIRTSLGGPAAGLVSLNPLAAPISHKTWSVAAGGSYNWNGKRTSFLADGSRMVSDGGGLLGAVRLISATAAVRRQLTDAFSSQLGVMYGNNHILGAFPSAFSSLKMGSINFSMSRTLGNSLLLTLGYARDLQQQYQMRLGPASINHNRGWATVSYHFKRSLGR